MVKIACACPHKYQENRYGKSVRVGNPIRSIGGSGRPKQSSDRARCSSCGNVRQIIGR